MKKICMNTLHKIWVFFIVFCIFTASFSAFFTLLLMVHAGRHIFSSVYIFFLVFFFF